MPTYTVVYGENPGPVQHPAITLVGADDLPWDPSDDIPANTYTDLRGSSLGRVRRKLLAGQEITVTVLGDSIPEGTTATTPGTDDMASLITSTLASRFGVAVTKNNRAQSGYTAQQIVQHKFTAALADNADLYILCATKNDLASDAGYIAQPGYGYPSTAQMGAWEYMIRRIQRERPYADIIVMSTTLYSTPGVGPDIPDEANVLAISKLAADLGCEWVDGRATFPNPPTGYLTDSVHPNSAGHALLANAVLECFPLTEPPAYRPPVLPEITRYSAERYTRQGWQRLSTVSTTASTPRFYNPSGTWTGTGPYVSSTANSTMRFIAPCSEMMIGLTTGAGAGVVHIDVNGIRTYSNVDLSLYGAGHPLPITGLGMGIHSVIVTVVSGTVTVNTFDYLAAAVTYIDVTHPLTTYAGSGAWAAAAALPSAYGGQYRFNNTSGNTATRDFIGTGIAVGLQRNISGVQTMTPTVDGVALSNITLATATGAVSEGVFMNVVSGLEYGRHTVSLALVGGGGVAPYLITGWAEFDETRLARPRRQAGMAVVGTAVVYPIPFAGRPLVSTNAVTTDTGIIRPTSGTASGFTPSGTASEIGTYEAEGGLVAY